MVSGCNLQLCAALGISDVMLLWQAGAAHLRDHEKQGFFESEVKSLLYGKDDFYGDQGNDFHNIEDGIEKIRNSDG